MSNSHFEETTVPNYPESGRRDTPLRATKRGRIVLGTTLALATAAASASLLVEGKRSNPEHPDAQQVVRNEQTLRQGDTILQGVLTLKKGVHIRTSPAIIEGDANNAPNLSYTVGDNGEKGMKITGGLEVINNNHPYLAFEMPNTENKTLKEKAANLRYVSMTVESSNGTGTSVIYDSEYASLAPYSYVSHGPSSVPGPNTRIELPIKNVAVDAIEANGQLAYEMSGSDQQGTESNILGAPALSSEYVN